MQTPTRGIERSVLILLMSGCALWTACEDADEPDSVDDGPAQILSTSRVRRHARDDVFDYGEEIRVLFDRDPGFVDIRYAGRAGHPVAGEGTLRAFVVLDSPIVLTWAQGGSATLEYAWINGDGGTPALSSAFPDPHGPRESAAEVNMRGVILRFDVPLWQPDRLIQEYDITPVEIEDSRGVSWEPTVTFDDFAVVLAPVEGHLFADNETYQVRLNGHNAFDDHYDFTIHFEFSTE